MFTLDDFIRGYQSDPQLDPPPGAMPAQPALAAQAAPAGQARPGILELLAGLNRAPDLPTLPQGDTSMIPGLALLRFAATQARQRQPGESRLSQALTGATGSLDYAMAEKRNIQNQAVADEAARRKLAEGDARIQSERLSNVRTTQDIIAGEEKRPLELDKLRQSLATARTDEQLKALELRAAQIKSKYVEDDARLAQEATRARTDDLKADAEYKRARAKLAIENADGLLKEIAEIRAGSAGKGRAAWKSVDKLPGERPEWYNAQTQEVVAGHFTDAANAERWAKAQAAALARNGMLPAGETEEKARARLMREAMTPNPKLMGEPSIPSSVTDAVQRGKPQGPGRWEATVAPGGQPSFTPPATANDAVNLAKAKEAGRVYVENGVAYFPDGRRMSEADAKAMAMPRAAAQPAQPSSDSGSLAKATVAQLYAAVSRGGMESTVATEELRRRGLLADMPTATSSDRGMDRGY